MAPNPNYQSYLLRFWRDRPDQPWRSSLQFIASGEKFAFGEVRDLFAFLVERLSMDEVVTNPTGTPIGPTNQVADLSTEDSSLLPP